MHCLPEGEVCQHHNGVGLEVWFQLPCSDDQHQDQFFQNGVTSLCILENMANVIYRLELAFFLSGEYRGSGHLGD